MKPSMRDIEWVVCHKFSLSRDDLRRRRRGMNAAPLHIAMYLMREMTQKSYPQIGALFCRDHTTVMYGARRISALIDRDEKLAQQVDECRCAVMACASRGENKHVAPDLAAANPDCGRTDSAFSGLA